MNKFYVYIRQLKTNKSLENGWLIAISELTSMKLILNKALSSISKLINNHQWSVNEKNFDFISNKLSIYNYEMWHQCLNSFCSIENDSDLKLGIKIIGIYI